MGRVKQLVMAVVLFAFVALIPLSAEAGLVPCGANTDDSATTYDETEQCTLCHIVKGISYLITYIRDIMVFVALAVITAMGIMYIVSAGNTGLMETAKKGIWAALAGIAIILLAWVVVNTVMYVIFDVKSGNIAVLKSFSITTGFTFNCEAGL